MSKNDVDDDSKDSKDNEEALGGPDEPSDISTHINLALTPPAKRALFMLYKETGESYRTIIRESVIQRARQLQRVKIPEIRRAIRDGFTTIASALEQQLSKERVQGSMNQFVKAFGKVTDKLPFKQFMEDLLKSEGPSETLEDSPTLTAYSDKEYSDHGEYIASNKNSKEEHSNDVKSNEGGIDE